MREVTALLIAIGLLSGCSGGDTFLALGKVAPQAEKGRSTSFTFQTVDDPSSTTNSVNGIDETGDIVGTIGNGTASSPYQGYFSAPPYTSFQSVTYGAAQGTVATSVTNAGSQTIIGGWVIYPPQLPGIWAFVQVNGLWTLMRDRKGGKGADTATEILGVNDAGFGVGFYKNPNTNNDVPVVVSIPTESFTALKPPGYKTAAATGINNFGDIAGWETASGTTVGFFLRLGSYYTFAHAKATATYGLGINSGDRIVGYYVDSAGKKHGFILTNPKTAQKWQTIDDPDAVHGTVVTGINDDGSICGYYFDGNNVQHGFIATPHS